MVENFDFGSQGVKNALTGKLTLLGTYNGLPVPAAYVFDAMERLHERFLKKSLIDVPRAVLQVEAKKITEMQKAAANQAEPVDIEKELANTPIEALDLSQRVPDSLSHSGIATVGDVLGLLEIGESALFSMHNFGESSLDQLRQKMQEKGYMKDD